MLEVSFSIKIVQSVYVQRIPIELSVNLAQKSAGFAGVGNSKYKQFGKGNSDECTRRCTVVWVQDFLVSKAAQSLSSLMW